MSRSEIRAFGSLIIAGIVVWFIQMRFLDGWQVVDVPASHMLSTYVIATIGMIVGEIVVTAGSTIGETMLNGAAAASASVEDERDQMIARRAELISHWFLIAVVNVLVLQLILQEAYPSPLFTPLAIVSTSGLIFSLLALLFAAHIVKMIATLVLYRL
ncbi:hypothetical protein [Hyphomonas sp.]|jgi:aspartate 1-decarboxylase|uniref:hypothetical protein n=1 Tax=Hyphomonas sp. TaxID=87 RepID=UPI00356844AF